MKFKKGDIIIVIILIAALGFWLYNNYITSRSSVDNLVIEINGNVYKRIPISELKTEQRIHIDIDENKYIDIVANEAGAHVEDVICPDKLCKKTGVINKIGQTIVCLPNKVVIYYEGKHIQDIDNVSY